MCLKVIVALGREIVFFLIAKNSLTEERDDLFKGLKPGYHNAFSMDICCSD